VKQGEVFTVPSAFRLRQSQAGGGNAGSASAVYRCRRCGRGRRWRCNACDFPGDDRSRLGRWRQHQHQHRACDRDCGACQRCVADVHGCCERHAFAAPSASEAVDQREHCSADYACFGYRDAPSSLSKVPISVRMWQHSDFYTGAHGVRFDVALNANIRDRLRIARVNGS
jgi:hypothetical protein